MPFAKYNRELRQCAVFVAQIHKCGSVAEVRELQREAKSNLKRAPMAHPHLDQPGEPMQQGCKIATADTAIDRLGCGVD